MCPSWFLNPDTVRMKVVLICVALLPLTGLPYRADKNRRNKPQLQLLLKASVQIPLVLCH